MPTLDYLSVRGFRSFVSRQAIQLRPINVLIGANGAGKSNFVSVFELLHSIRDGVLNDYVARAGGAERLLHFGSKTTDEIRLNLGFEQGAKRYSVRLEFASGDQLRVSYQDLVESQEGDSSLAVDDWFAKQLGSWRVYHFHDTGFHSPMKKTASLHDNRYLRSDASNLAAFLYLLRERHPNSYRVVRKAVQRVAPFFDDFQLKPLELTGDTLLLEWRHVGSDAYWNAGSLSDGTLRFIALATLLLQPVELRPSIIILDEPELGLHPFAIAMLAGMIKQAAVDTQVIVSTQSSLLLDHFEPEDVLVADREDGATTLTRLDSEHLEDWLEDYSLGQLWEKNQLGGRPRAA